MKELKIFSGRANESLARRICEFLNLNLGDCKCVTFPDGEFHCKIEDVRGTGCLFDPADMSAGERQSARIADHD